MVRGNMNCEMCGKAGAVCRASVEGVEMAVCERCAKFGKVLSRIEQWKEEKHRKKEEEAEEEPEVFEGVVDDYADIIKNAREKAGLKQEEVALKVNEKESVIHKVESGHLKPQVMLARKLEKFFRIRLVEEVTVEKEKLGQKKGSDVLTIGDLIKSK